jgi:serine/threonine protein phosphatase 1
MKLISAPAALPPGQWVYAIGDVHGCADRLAAMHDAIADDLAVRPTEAPLLVHLGDYVNRGPDSAGVVARLAAGPPVPGLPTINLMGNHERTVLEALAGDKPAATDWLAMGGRAALESWGIDPASSRKQWPASAPQAHLAFLRELHWCHRVGPYLFVRAGIRPGVPLDHQNHDDLLRIRQAFLASKEDFGVVVVHGHTPRPKLVLRANRIGIDTRACLGGKLTCVILEGDRLGFIQT